MGTSRYNQAPFGGIRGSTRGSSRHQRRSEAAVNRLIRKALDRLEKGIPITKKQAELLGKYGG